VAFSLGAHNDPIIFAKSTPFPGRRDGWKEIGVIFKRYPGPECEVNEWYIWRCDGVVRCVRKHGVEGCVASSVRGKALWLVYLLTHLAQAKTATQLWVHLTLRAQSYCTWDPDAIAVCLTQGMFLLMS